VQAWRLMLRLRRVPAQSDAEFHRFRADLRGELDALRRDIPIFERLLEFREFVELGAYAYFAQKRSRS